MSQGDVEVLIALASSLKETVRSLCEEYLKRPAVIERERRVLANRDITALLALKEEYDAQNLRVESLVDALQQSCQQLGHWQAAHYPQLTTAEVRVPQTVSEAIALLDLVRTHLVCPELAKKVFDHLVGGVKAAWAEFLTRKAGIEPQIEQNRYMLEALMRSYQESYCFWQELVEQTVTNYDPSGKQRTTGRGSGFAVRA